MVFILNWRLVSILHLVLVPLHLKGMNIIFIGDEFNHAKSAAEQLYHTKVKPFNLLHPNSNFAANPEILNIDEIDIVDMPGFNRKYPLSSKHQVTIKN